MKSVFKKRVRLCGRAQQFRSTTMLFVRQSFPSGRLIAICALLQLIVIAGVGATVWDMRRVALNDARHNLGGLGIALAEQTTRSIQAIDLVLQDLSKDIARQQIDTVEDFKTRLHTQAVQATLAHRASALPQADAFSLIAADGSLVNYSRAWPVAPTELADRDYFNFLRDNDASSPFISAPVQNRGNGGWTLYIARRVNGRHGELIGMVLGAVDLNYFREFYKTLVSGGESNFVLLTRSGTVLASYPIALAAGTQVHPGTPWQAIVNERIPSTFIASALMVPGRRIVAVHPLSEYPLVVDVGMSQWAALKEWRRTAGIVGAGVIAAALCMIQMLRALNSQVRRLERQTEELQAGRECLAEKSSALGTTLEHMNQGIMMVNARRVVVVCNAQAVAMLDLPQEWAERQLSYDDLLAHQQASGEFGLEDTPAWAGTGELHDKPLVYERRRPNGRLLEIQTVKLADGGIVRTYTDITDRRRSEEQVRYLAQHDGLTNLVNRSTFQKRLSHAIELADVSRCSVAVLYLDLDRFKLVNDTRGHGTGDKLLVQVAERLQSAIRDVDTIGRMGGDEFAIIQPLIQSPTASCELAERLLHLISQPFDVEGAQCSIGLSIGIAHYPEHAGTSADLQRNADTALYRAKADGRGVARLFEEQMDVSQQRLFRLERDLKEALENNQFSLVYQPVINTVTRSIKGFEALLRWHHPDRGLIGPTDFIGLAEKCGAIIPIGLWVLETACAEAATWPGDIRIAINLSPVQFNQADLVEQVKGVLNRTGLPPHRLALEITEGVLLAESSVVERTMTDLRALGVRFVLDDFGTAHSGLSYLRQFCFDAIKIDKSFVQDMVSHSDASAIVAAILDIGSALELGVIAEGVETEEQLVELTTMKCAFAQGYLVGHPLPADQTRQHIAANRNAPLVAEDQLSLLMRQQGRPGRRMLAQRRSIVDPPAFKPSAAIALAEAFS